MVRFLTVIPPYVERTVGSGSETGVQVESHNNDSDCQFCRIGSLKHGRCFNNCPQLRPERFPAFPSASPRLVAEVSQTVPKASMLHLVPRLRFSNLSEVPTQH
jgi:hypothetical protein